MKKILIAGANSYIGVSLENYLNTFEGAYQVETLDVIGDGWKAADLSGYDAMVCVAGIAHQKETAENAPLYYRVNRDLAAELAKKAKEAGIGQFVFLSSMSVYGVDEGVITPETVPAPVSNYGKSKLEAEVLLAELREENFAVAMLRPPMVYGRSCRGNFQLMRKLVEKSPLFPAVNNRRSMISVTNLCGFIRLAIDRRLDGLFCPQNREYVNTTEMAKLMADAMGRKVWFSSLAGFGVAMLMPLVGKAKKAFGSLSYEGWETFDYCYCEETLDESVRRSV